MTEESLKVHAEKVSKDFVRRYRRMNGQRKGHVPARAYADLQRSLERQILLVGSRQRTS